MNSDSLVLLRNLPELAVCLARAVVSSRVSGRTKAHLALTVLYAASPLDLLPELLLGNWGLVDDVLVVVVAIDRVLNREDPAVVSQLWPGGDEAELELVQRIFARWAARIERYVSPVAVRLMRRFLGDAR